MGKARTLPNILRVVLGAYVQYWQCEASEQKQGQKPKSEQNGHQLAQNRPDATLATWTLFGHNLVIFHPILTFFFYKMLVFQRQIEW